MWLAMAGRWRSMRWRPGAAKRRLLMLLVAVLAVVMFAPSIVLHTPLRERVLTTAVPPDVGRVTVTSLTAGWLTPVTAKGVTLYDTKGNRLADVERLSIDRTVIGLLSSPRNLGTIRLEKPTIYVLVRPEGSNLEDALAKAIDDESSDEQLPGSAGGPDYKLEVVDGRLLSRSAVTGETWSADSLSITVRHPARGPLRIEAAGMVRPAPGDGAGTWAPDQGATAGRFELRWGGDQSGKLDGVRFVCQHLPLAAIEPWLQRGDSKLRVAGVLTGEVSASYPVGEYDSLSGDTTGRIALKNFAITGTPLAGEQLAVNDTNLAWKCAATGGRVSIENMSLASDLAMFDLRGAIDERAVRGVLAGTSPPQALVTHGDLEAEGRLNLARLAQRLPGLLKVREGTTITSGQVRFNARSIPQSAGHQVTVSLTTTPLAAATRGRAIEWDAPLDINLVAKHTAGGWRFDRLACQSQFLSVTGAGDARHMELAGQVDLDELTTRLDQFVDLTDWQLAGRGEVTAECRRDQTGQFTASADGTLSDFVVAYRGDQMVTEPKLEWTAEADGSSPQGGIWPNRLSRGKLALTATGDELSIELMQPTVVENNWSATDWPLSVATVGGLDGWSRRLRPWVNLSEWQMGGQLQLSARGRAKISPLIVNIATSAVTISGLRATTSKWQVDEPRVEWSGDISWDSDTSTLVSRSGQLVSSSVTASFRDWFWTADPKQTSRVGGLAAVRLGLGRLARAQRQPTAEPQRLTPIGEMSGQVKLAAQSGQVVATVDISGKNIRLQAPQPALPGAQPKMQTIWQEPSLRLLGTVSYLPKADSLKFYGLQAQSSTLALAASGSVDQLHSHRLVDVAGTVDYDLASLTQILAQYVGDGLTLTGREQARFEVKGALETIASIPNVAAVSHDPAAGVEPPTVRTAPVSNTTSPSWYALVLAPWQSASLYGLPIGPGRIAAELKAGQVSIEPLDFEVGGGRFTASPSINISPTQSDLTLPAGPLLTNVRITPAVSERMLKYIAPILSGATQTEGVFSVSLNGATIPLGNPRASDVAGQLAVDSIRVVPGPELAGLLDLVRDIEALVKARELLSGGQRAPVTLLSMSDRTIDFRLVDGRVYHQGLEFQVENWVVRSRGSVGLDESLSLMLEVLVPQQGLGRRFQTLGITRLEIPVTGTLRNWHFDTRAVFDSLKQQAVGQFLNEETIGNALDKLFGTGR